MNTPSKRVIYFLIFATLIVTGVITVSAYKQKNTRPNVSITETTADLAIVVTNEYQNIDSDSDGLFDWEENLWGTDSLNSDTDNDGTKDGREVALSRDPNKKGPDDMWTPNSYLEEYVAASNIDPNSLTSRIAKNLLIGVGQQKTDITEDLLAQIKSEIQIRPTYKKENLITFNPADKTKLQNYADNFILIYQNETNKTIANPTAGTDVYVNAYKNMALSLSIIEVPEDIAALHTEYINNLSALSSLTEIIAQAESDPIKMIAVMPEYDRIFQSHETVLEQLKAYMQKNAIIFNIDA